MLYDPITETPALTGTRSGGKSADASERLPSTLPALRPIPYPYRALLAISSDLDETPDASVYWNIMRFLNTRHDTSMGPGLDLEIGNSIYFDMPAGQFAYWSTDDMGRAMLCALMRSGHVDCLHSYGDLATTRAHAGRALDELSRRNCHIDVWVDHARAPSNFGADIMHGHGDVPGSPVYHADLTCDFGIRYVWRGRVTSIIGQDVPASLGGIYKYRHPWLSARTLTKEALKHTLARYGSPKYAMHTSNRIVREVCLRDDRPVYEFLRANPHWAGVSRGETADGLADVLAPHVLDLLALRGGVCALYTHLGKTSTQALPFGPRTQGALRLLAQRHHQGEILVTTTRRLLAYCRALRELTFSSHVENGRLYIDLMSPALSAPGPLSEGDLAGLTFYVEEPRSTCLTFNGRELSGLKQNPSDYANRHSISVPWTRLTFPDL